MIQIKYRGDLSGDVRPRFTRTGRMYQTKAQTDYKKAVRERIDGLQGKLKNGPLRVRIVAFYPAPKRQKVWIERKYTKPDLDNIPKPIYDAIFKLREKRKGSKRWDDGLPECIPIDDSRIVESHIVKYSTHNKHLWGFNMMIENIGQFPSYLDIFEDMKHTEGQPVLSTGDDVHERHELGQMIEKSAGFAAYEKDGECYLLGHKGSQPWLIKMEKGF